MYGQLPPQALLTVVTQPPALEALDELLAEAGVLDRTRIVVASESSRLTVWVQDMFLVIGGNASTPHLLCSRAVGRDDDGHVADVLAAAGVVTVSDSDLMFEGGQILVGDDFVLIGRDCLDATARELGPATARKSFTDVFRGRHLMFVGTAEPVQREGPRPCTDDTQRMEFFDRESGVRQPTSHIDMFISLAGRDMAGRYRLLVGSPALADELVGRPTPDHALQDAYDEIAKQLSGEGFEVIRTPLPRTYGDGLRMVEGEQRAVRLWYHATANNCLVQIDEAAGNHVWLPTYGHGAWRELAVIDATHRDTWRELGFTVHELPSFHPFAQRLGAVRCITKVLAR